MLITSYNYGMQHGNFLNQLTTGGFHIVLLFIAPSFSILVRVGLFWETIGVVKLYYCVSFL